VSGELVGVTIVTVVTAAGDGRVGVPVSVLAAASVDAFASAAEIPFVPATVAVVVPAVADLSGLCAAPSAPVQHPLVGATVAVIVASVALFARLSAALTTAVQRPLVDPAITVLVHPVAPLRGLRSAPATAVLHAFIRGAVAVVVRVVTPLLRDRPALAAGVGDPLVGDPVAVVVPAVAHLGRLSAAPSAPVQHPLVGGPVAVIVASVALFGRLGAALTTAVHRALVGEAITVLIDPVAHLGRLCATRPTPIQYPLVDLAITVVVHPVAPLRRLRSALATPVLHALVRGAVAVVVRIVTPLPRDRPTLAAGVGDPLVGGPIAVVVPPIASLLRWGRCVAADPVPTLAAFFTGPARRPARPRQPLVEPPVAVIVHTIAALLLRRPGHTLELHAPLTTGRRAPAATRPDTAPLRADEVLVGDPIAVLIGSVTVIVDLPRPTRLPLATGETVYAAYRPLALAGSSTHAAGITDAEALVRLAVAVVVRAVACLMRGQDLPGASIPRPLLARRSAGLTGPDPGLLGFALEALHEDALVSCAIAVFVDPVAALGGQRTASATGIESALVDLAITVVVDPVADLGGRRPAASAVVGDAFVGGPIAVVVEPVTDLGFWGARRRRARQASGSAVAAHLTGGLADAPPPLAGRPCAGDVVHHPVAVIVQLVADLLGRRALSRRTLKLARLGIADEDTLAPTPAGPLVTDPAPAWDVVDLTVAVVVEPVAAPLLGLVLVRLDETAPLTLEAPRLGSRADADPRATQRVGRRLSPLALIHQRVAVIVEPVALLPGPRVRAVVVVVAIRSATVGSPTVAIPVHIHARTAATPWLGDALLPTRDVLTDEAPRAEPVHRAVLSAERRLLLSVDAEVLPTAILVAPARLAPVSLPWEADEGGVWPSVGEPPAGPSWRAIVPPWGAWAGTDRLLVRVLDTQRGAALRPVDAGRKAAPSCGGKEVGVDR